MAEIILALARTLSTLARARIWGYVLYPALLSLVLWMGLVIWGLGGLVDRLMQYPPMTLLVAWGVAWLASVLAYVGGWMIIFAATYLTASLLTAILVVPWLLQAVAEQDYPELAAVGKDSFVAAAVNSTLASIIFCVAWVISVPFWLIPGMSFVLPLLLMAWYNRRTFAYDALSVHATAEEWKMIRRTARRPFLVVGLIMAALAHVPFVGLLVPTLAALAYIHLGLELLRRLRGGAVVSGEARRLPE